MPSALIPRKPCLGGLHRSCGSGEDAGDEGPAADLSGRLQPVGLCKASVTDGGVWARRGSALPAGKGSKHGTCVNSRGEVSWVGV